MLKKFIDIILQFELALYFTNWLSETIFIGGGGKEIRATTIYLACRMIFRVRFALAPTRVGYLCSELQTMAFMTCFWMSIN